MLKPQALRRYGTTYLDFDFYADDLLTGRVSIRTTDNSIWDVYIDPDDRGLGLGRQLMLETLELLRSQGHLFTFLYVSLDNEPALNLYASLGFQVDALRLNSAFRMVLDLQETPNVDA